MKAKLGYKSLKWKLQNKPSVINSLKIHLISEHAQSVCSYMLAAFVR